MQKNKKVNHIHSKVTFKAGLVIKTFLKKTLQNSRIQKDLKLKESQEIKFCQKKTH